MKTSIIEKWLWEREAMKTFASTAMIISLILACMLYFPLGFGALWIIPGLGLFVLFFILVYGTIGKKIAALSQSLTKHSGKIAQGLIVNGVIQSPGIVIMREKEIDLVPIAGERLVVPLDSVAAVREVKWFNGSRLWGKTGFWLDVPDQSRLGFAIGATIATQWSKRLRNSWSETTSEGIDK